MTDTTKKKIAHIEEEQRLKRRTMVQDTLARLRANPSARVGGILVILMVSLAVIIPIVDNTYAPRSNLSARYQEPGCIILEGGETIAPDASRNDQFFCQYLFGADKNGRSILRRVGHGMSTSLAVSVLVVALAFTTGTSLGLISGFLGGWVDTVIMRGIDILLAFPALLLAIVLVTILGTGLQNGMIAIAITQVPIYARLARSMAISIREQEYIQAARSIGVGDGRLILRHVLPNSLSPLIVQSTLLMGTAVIETAALGFLGLGQQPPYPELGKMLADSQEALASGKWWLLMFPGITIVLIVLGFNLLGDGLRDALDPRLKSD